MICTRLKPLYWPQKLQSQELRLAYGTDKFLLQNQQLTVTDTFNLNSCNNKNSFAFVTNEQGYPIPALHWSNWSRASILCDFSREISRDLYETILVGKL